MYGFSIDSLASGAVAERLQRAAEAVYRNIADPNTPALAKRTITLKIVFDPDEDREVAAAAMDVSVKLAPDKQIKTNFCIGVDGGKWRNDAMLAIRDWLVKKLDSEGEGPGGAEPPRKVDVIA
jgi:undecaprenyl pyrophosphate synthase